MLDDKFGKLTKWTILFIFCNQLNKLYEIPYIYYIILNIHDDL